MADIKIEVTAYAGYRGEERPRAFMIEGRNVDVLKILETWITEEELSRKQKRFFTVQGSDDCVYTLYCDLDSAEWFLRGREQRT